MPLITNFYTGVSGLTSSQNAINITAHNVANVHTEGYVRQQVQFSDTAYKTYGNSKVNTMQIGYGVNTARTLHYRDILLDMAYREQSGRENYYSMKYNAMDEVMTIFGEMNNQRFQKNMSDLWSALSEVGKMPDDAVARSSLIMNADAFMTRAKEVYDDLFSYQERLDEKIIETVDKINVIAAKIDNLNDLIQGIEGPDIEQAMNFRDQRDLLLDELGGLINIEYSEDHNGYVTVRAEGEEFITKGGYFPMGIEMRDGPNKSTFVTPVWPHNHKKGEPAKEVFNFDVEISTSKDNDIGELKGILQSRGRYTANYTDIPHIGASPKMEDYTDENGVFDQAGFDAAVDQYWNVDYPAYEKAVQVYNTTVGNSPIMKVQAMFDQLINGIVSTINGFLCPETQTTIPAGTQLTISAGTIYNQLSDEMKAEVNAAGLGSAFNAEGIAENDFTLTLAADMTVKTLDNIGEDSKAHYGMDDNKTPGTELFSRSDTSSRYTVAKGSDGNTYYIYNPYNEFGTESLYTLGNLEINKVALDDYSYLPFSTKDGLVDMDFAQSILDKWDEEFINIDPDNMTPKDFKDYYDYMVEIIGNDGYIYQKIADNQNTVVNTIDNARISFTGVSSTDELTNLIKFKNAYNANSRYINVVADMLDTLINRVGHW